MKNIEFPLRQGDEFIPLIQLLKAAGCVESGTEAQQVVVEGMVSRNGSIELRKRAKCIPGDVIIFDGWSIKVSQ